MQCLIFLACTRGYVISNFNSQELKRLLFLLWQIMIVVWLPKQFLHSILHYYSSSILQGQIYNYPCNTLVINLSEYTVDTTRIKPFSTHVCTERIFFDSQTFMCNKIFLKKLLQECIAQIFTLLLAHFTSKLVNYWRHSETLNFGMIRNRRHFPSKTAI